MMKIKDINNALQNFEDASRKHGEATENGDYNSGNKCYKNIVSAINFLKKENAIKNLQNYFSNPNVGMRLWAACYLLPMYEKDAIQTLTEITKMGNIHSLTAETTIEEWCKGNLKF